MALLLETVTFQLTASGNFSSFADLCFLLSECLTGDLEAEFPCLLSDECEEWAFPELLGDLDLEWDLYLELDLLLLDFGLLDLDLDLLCDLDLDLDLDLEDLEVVRFLLDLPSFTSGFSVITLSSNSANLAVI